MELQIALDRLPFDRAVALAALVAPHADWIEVGTSLIKRYGVAAIRAVVDAAGPVPVLADTKTADDASTTCCRYARRAELLASVGPAPHVLRTADLAALAPARASVGAAVTSAPDPLAAVIELRAATERPPEGTP